MIGSVAQRVEHHHRIGDGGVDRAEAVRPVDPLADERHAGFDRPLAQALRPETAAALQHVVVVHQTYQKQIATAPPSERQRLAADANQAIKKAVTDQGLSVSEYNSILDLAQNDPGVRAKLIDRIKGTDGSRP